MPSPLDILITGGTGYIGGNLIPVLLARGYRMRVLAREESVKPGLAQIFKDLTLAPD